MNLSIGNDERLDKKNNFQLVILATRYHYKFSMQGHASITSYNRFISLIEVGIVLGLSLNLKAQFGCVILCSSFHYLRGHFKSKTPTVGF